MLPYQGPMPPATLHNRIIREPGKADPIWDTAFRTKFSKMPEANAELAQPKGALQPMQRAMSRIDEIRYLAETQHLELATTQELLKANDIEPENLVNGYAVCIGEEVIEPTPCIAFLMDLFGIENKPVPVYTGMAHAATIARRIEWEKWSDAKGTLHKVVFDKTKDGSLGIRYIGYEKSLDVILAQKRAMKARWLELHGELPTVEAAMQRKETIEGLRILDVMVPEEHEAYIQSRMFGTEDPDPGRIAHHADPDPKPQRSQYPFGLCWHCDKKKNNHRDCAVLGWDLYYEDLGRWTARQDDRGYAGPSGVLGYDDDSSSD